MERLFMEVLGFFSLTFILGEGLVLRYDLQDRFRRLNGKNVVRGVVSFTLFQVCMMNGWYYFFFQEVLFYLFFVLLGF